VLLGGGEEERGRVVNKNAPQNSNIEMRTQSYRLCIQKNYK